MRRTISLRILLLVAAVALISSTAWVPAATTAVTSPTRIRFEPGATSAQVSGDLPANGSIRYVIYAGAGQLMDVTLSAPEGGSLKVSRADGRTLPPVPGTSGSTGFRGYLPYTGNYYITVRAGGQAISYGVNVFIPVRIRFASGATSATRPGKLNAFQGLDYIARAAKGQILVVDATPPADAAGVQLIIYGVDGTVLRSGMGEGSSFRGELPLSEDYIISVRAGEQATEFTLQVIVPQRISFPSGSFSGRVYTYLLKDHTQYYVLRAMQAQTMTVEITPANHLQLAIYGMDGVVLKNASDGGASFSGQLPSTQEYFLVVTNSGNPVNYRLRVTIQ
jgi:hypothetical protein